MIGHLAEQEQPSDTPHRVSPEDDAVTELTLHNTPFKLTEAAVTEMRKLSAGGIAADQLRSIVERIEKLEVEKAELASDIADIFTEAKSNGYDVKTLRKIIRLRAMDAAERDEAEHLLDTYCIALGMRQPDLFDEEEQG